MKFKVLMLLVTALAGPRMVQATIYRHITAETTSPYNATIDANGNLIEDGITYACIDMPYLKVRDDLQSQLCL